MYLDATARFVVHSNAFLAQLAESGLFPSGSLPPEMSEETAFRARSEFYFHYFMTHAGSSPFALILQMFQTPRRARRSILDKAVSYLRWLLYANASRAAGDINLRIIESRRQFERQIRKRLQEVLTSAEQGLALAKEKSAGGKSQIDKEIAKMTAILEAVETLRHVP